MPFLPGSKLPQLLQTEQTFKSKATIYTHAGKIYITNIIEAHRSIYNVIKTIIYSRFGMFQATHRSS